MEGERTRWREAERSTIKSTNSNKMGEWKKVVFDGEFFQPSSESGWRSTSVEYKCYILFQDVILTLLLFIRVQKVHIKVGSTSYYPYWRRNLPQYLIDPSVPHKQHSASSMDRRCDLDLLDLCELCMQFGNCLFGRPWRASAYSFFLEQPRWGWLLACARCEARPIPAVLEMSKYPNRLELQGHCITYK